MLAIRYINDVDVQGWEPTLDGAADAGLASLELPYNFSSSPMASTEKALPISRRQDPPTRAQAAAYPIARDFTPLLRPGPSPLQQGFASASASASAYRSSTQLLPVSSSARNAAAAGRSSTRPRSSTERKIARKLAENANYVPRPKNSFILFRTEFVAQRTGTSTDSSSRGSKRRKGNDNGSVDEEEEEEEANQSLSKQASAIWNRMTEAQKRPWAERAKLEKAEHEAKYPDYRYKPARQASTRRSAPVASKSAPYPRRPSPQRMSSEASTMVAFETKEEVKTPVVIDADQFGDMYFPSAVSSSSTLDDAIQMPVPLHMLSLPIASPSSSELANALGSPPPATQVQVQTRSPTTGPALPTVPPVPSLSLSGSTPSRTIALPPIPRSPSAPAFDTRVVGHFPQQAQHFAAAGLFQTQNGSSSPYSSAFVARPASCSSTPQIPVFAVPEASSVPAPTLLSSGSEMTMQSALPTRVGAEAEYFRDFAQYEDDEPAGPAFVFENQHMFTNETTYEERNDDNSETHLGVDIDMHALLSLSPVPEVPENENENGNGAAQQPLEAVAALWVQDQLRMSDLAAETGMEHEHRTQMPMQMQSTPMEESPFVSFSPENIPAPEVGMGTYALAVNEVHFSGCVPPSAASARVDNGDLFRLDLDLDLELGCAAHLPASTLSFSALGGDAPADDVFGYDRERGLYGFGYELGVGSGFDYGF